MVNADPQQAWSERKARILTAYAERFCASLSLGTAVALVDGDAGPASYGEGRWQTPGAPVVVAEHVAALAARSGRPMRSLSLADPGDAPDLSRALQPLGGLAGVRQGAWAEQGRELLGDLGGSAALVLLDTAAPVPIAGDLEHLARRLAKTEVLVRYSRPAVAALLAALDDEEQARAAEGRLNRLFGARSWRGVAEGASGEDERDRQLRDLYVQKLLEIGGGRFKWAAACPIRTSWGAIAYDLVFASPDRAAGPAMGDV
ncbi:MAG TPA: three-Cys-motif partner protein TcmP, partial [Herpetosiphonaceae bacterium]|nr:three-Cys-motif partner protein TcmP [Herpetosiphonaceae bacterium]